MIPAAELQAIRDELERTLPDTCVISRDTTSEGSYGRPGVSGTVTVATVACRISPLSSAEGIELDAVTARTTLVVTLPAGTDVAAGDRITSDGRTFEVTGGTAERSWELSKRVLAEEA